MQGGVQEDRGKKKSVARVREVAAHQQGTMFHEGKDASLGDEGILGEKPSRELDGSGS